MKPKILANLLILTSVAFLTACSNTTPNIKKDKLSNHERITIERARMAAYMESLPLAKTYPVQENYTAHKTYIMPKVDTYNNRGEVSQPKIASSSSIEVVSYASSRPTIQKTYQYNNYSIKNKIEQDAKRFLGIRYVWGATGPNKFDCSGFTQWVYRDSGIKIPRVSRDQAKVGQYVSYSNLKKGDMVFFDTKKRKTGRVTHVGIYLGNNNFIHASSGAKKVVIYNFNSKPYYKKRFLWGRRVINSDNHLAMR